MVVYGLDQIKMLDNTSNWDNQVGDCLLAEAKWT